MIHTSGRGSLSTEGRCLASLAGERPASLDASECRDLCAVAGALVGLAASSSACRLDKPSLLCEMRRIAKQCTDPDPPGPRQFTELYTRFYMAVGELSSNVVLTAVLADVLVRLSKYLELAACEAEHRASLGKSCADLLDALLGGDAEEAQRVATAQAHRSRWIMMEAILRLGAEAEHETDCGPSSTPPHLRRVGLRP